METIEIYEKELNQSMNSLSQRYQVVGLDFKHLQEIEEKKIPKDLKEYTRRSLEKMEFLRRKIANLKA
jgi:hypothetical protein